IRQIVVGSYRCSLLPIVGQGTYQLISRSFFCLSAISLKHQWMLDEINLGKKIECHYLTDGFKENSYKAGCALHSDLHTSKHHIAFFSLGVEAAATLKRSKKTLLPFFMACRQLVEKACGSRALRS